MFHASFWTVPGLLVLLSAGFVSLGRWQLDRAEVNRAIENRFNLAEQLPVLDRPVGQDRVDEVRYRKVALSGHYEAGVQILLDNMTRDGQAGYEVLTPFSVDGLDRLVVVNRGWVPAAWNRDELPDIALRNEARTLSGRIDRLPRAGITLGEASRSDESPVIVMSFPDFDDLEAALGRQLYPFQLLLDPTADLAFRRDWGPPQGLADRNIAYAVQWFGLAALALIIAIGAAVRSYRTQTPGAR